MYVPAPKVEEKPKTLESEIQRLSRKYGVNETMLRAIVRCESSNNINAVGRKAVVGKDYGPLQINSHYHQARMQAKGLSITNWADSLEYGVALMAKEGSQPWTASRHCHGY